MQLVRVILLILLFAASASAQTTRKVYAGGTSGAGDDTYTNAQLQTALNDAEPGDSVLLQESFVYEGSFVLPTKTCVADNVSCYITVRTGVDSAGTELGSGLFPATNVRVSYATHFSTYAKLKVATNNTPALRTELAGECGSPPCVPKWWRIKHLAMGANAFGGSTLVLLGYWDLSFAGSAVHQDTKAKIPSDIIFEQNIVHGDLVSGQHRCMAVSAKDITIRDNVFKDCKTEQNDGQAIAITNTTGPIIITNNLIEGSTENVIIGGFDVISRQSTTTSSASSASVFTVGHVTELEVGQWIGVGGPDTDDEQSTQVTAINGTELTVSPALSATPSNGTAVRWSLHVGDVTFTKNHVRKPLEWRDPVVPTPGTPSATPTTGGSLANGTYYYKIVAWHNVNHGQMYRSTASAEGSCTLSGGNNACQLQWAASANVTATYTGEYYIYGRTQGGQNIRFSISPSSAGCSAGTGTCTFTDVGDAGTSEAVPTTAGNVWSVKNLFETKECGAQNGTSCLIEGNIFEQSWFSANGQQAGAIVLHVLQEGDRMPSVVTRNLTFRNNKIRLAATALSLASTDTQNMPSGRGENLTIQNNLFYQLGQDQGNYTWTIQLSSGSFRPSMCGRNSQAASGITFDHNTFISTSANRGYLVFLSAAEACDELWTYENLKIKNNIFMRGAETPVSGFGMNYLTPAGSFTADDGDATWAAISSGASKEWAKNVIENATASEYEDCTGCIIPADLATFEAQFVDYDGGDYSLAAGSAWNNAGTDGTDIGANIDTIEAFTDIALSGDDSSGTGPFGDVAHPVPGRLEFEYFDFGAAGVAYTDNSPTNEGGEFRATEVDISLAEDTDGGYTVSFAGAGEWLHYTVDVAATRFHTIRFRVACDGEGGTFDKEFKGQNVTGSIQVPDTGGWLNWVTITKTDVPLVSGEQVWRVVLDTNGPVTGATGNFNWMASEGVSRARLRIR
jgi:hypothetical protein